MEDTLTVTHGPCKQGLHCRNSDRWIMYNVSRQMKWHQHIEWSLLYLLANVNSRRQQLHNLNLLPAVPTSYSSNTNSIIPDTNHETWIVSIKPLSSLVSGLVRVVVVSLVAADKDLSRDRGQPQNHQLQVLRLRSMSNLIILINNSSTIWTSINYLSPARRLSSG